ncbi:MAG TPA: hypothetical protein QGG06_05505 [Gammaproteobacteria bacterium]|jgi:heme O synthase-like polyprenyltransferase|nr:hypothetical protein [Gammaproteobacteria bacterium]HJP42950.1 hypothetical protein [Gammaproteobacteria bacterium]|tara:strand:+ start:137 stop:376 length:240 start_codon:yes stop_codon:yes gene_type:complete
MLPLELIIRALSIIFGLIIFILAIIFGWFIFSILVGVLFFIWIIFYVRSLWNRRREKTGANDAIIDAEYTVIDVEDSDD